MANPEHLARLKQGVEAWNRWREEEPSPPPDLQGAHLERAELRRANLILANLEGAKLAQANLRRADLRSAILRRSDLTLADLCGANVSNVQAQGCQFCQARMIGADLHKSLLSKSNLARADLRSASLRMADLAEATLARALLHMASLRGARLSGTILSASEMDQTEICNVDLCGAIGLLEVIHLGPSSIGTDTLDLTGKSLAEKRLMEPEVITFLRGAGVQESHIESLKQGPEFHSLFLSYSSKDEDFARRLHADLQENGVRCWFAPHDVQGGRKLYEQIGEAIARHDRLLLILSEHSMASNWVKTEIDNARQREVNEGTRVLFPIRLVDFEAIKQWRLFDADAGTDSAREIREYFIPDFSNWSDGDSYQKALERLLNDLRADS